MIDRVHRCLLRLFRRLPVSARQRVVRALAPGFVVGAMSFLERSDGRVLLVRLSYRQRWGVPGGLLKRGEGAGAAARREALEEVGLRIELVGEPAVVVDPAARRVDVVFRARPASGENPDRARACSPEISAVGWFLPDRLPELQHEAAGALGALARSARRPQSVSLPGAAEG